MNLRLFGIALLIATTAAAVAGDAPAKEPAKEPAKAAAAEPAKGSDKVFPNEGGGEPIDPHLALFYTGTNRKMYRSTGRFPSASECRPCHEQHYREWSTSMHGFAQLSPTMEAQNAEILRQFNGTIDSFCTRCHTPVGTTLGEPPDMLNKDRDPVSIEGVTCIVCHRIDAKFGRVVGALRITEGTVFAKVFGTSKDNEMSAVAKKPGVATKPGDQGAKMHADGGFFEPIKTSAFCGQCHDVFNPTNVRLQQTFSQWQSSHAAAQGVRCQDCHLGQVPGKPAGFRVGPAAILPGRNGYKTKDRPLTSHFFAGPDVPTEHPGVFPHGARDNRGASLKPEDKDKLEELLNAVDAGFLSKITSEQWWQFDYIQGWGTDEFEKKAAKTTKFPEFWKDPAKRAAAAEFIRQQRELIADYMKQREILIKNGSAMGKFTVPVRQPQYPDGSSMHFSVEVKNQINAHNIPSGFNFFRQLWLHVQVITPSGRVVWESGQTDPSTGDLLNFYNNNVRSGQLHADKQLWNAQARLTIRGEHGADRPIFFPINTDADPTPQLRPNPFPNTLRGRDNAFRIDVSKVLPPEALRTANYCVPIEAFREPGTYQVKATLKMRGIPPYFFLYFGITRNLPFTNEGIVDVESRTAELKVEAPK